MDKIIKIRRSLRLIALTAAFVMAACLVAPAGTADVQAAETVNGDTVKGITAKDVPIIGASGLTFAVGEKGTLSTSSNKTPADGYTWKTKNSKILSITKGNCYTAKKAGSTVLYRYYKGKKMGSSTIKVYKNKRTYSTSQTPRKTGYTSYTQSGKHESPTVNTKLLSVEYLANRKVRLKFQLKNISKNKWTVRTINRLALRTINSSSYNIINLNNLRLSSGFTLGAGKTITWTLTLSGKGYIKSFRDLTQTSVKYVLDWWV